jgi:hypothetical protein
VPARGGRLVGSLGEAPLGGHILLPMDMGPQEPDSGQRPGERWGNGVARAATLIGVLSAVSLLLGFLRDVVIAAVFGASAELDAYLVAQGLMNVVLGLVAGALAKAVVPVVAPAVASGRVDPGLCEPVYERNVIVISSWSRGRRAGSSA